MSQKMKMKPLKREDIWDYVERNTQVQNYMKKNNSKGRGMGPFKFSRFRGNGKKS